MNLSQRPFKLALAVGNELVRRPRGFNFAVNSMLNVVSVSTTAISDLFLWPAVCFINGLVA